MMRNSKSSATGWHQFLDGTWADVLGYGVKIGAIDGGISDLLAVGSSMNAGFKVHAPADNTRVVRNVSMLQELLYETIGSNEELMMAEQDRIDTMQELLARAVENGQSSGTNIVSTPINNTNIQNHSTIVPVNPLPIEGQRSISPKISS